MQAAEYCMRSSSTKSLHATRPEGQTVVWRTSLRSTPRESTLVRLSCGVNLEGPKRTAVSFVT